MLTPYRIDILQPFYFMVSGLRRLFERPWMLPRVAHWGVAQVDLSEGAYWIVDDTGFPKKGRHSVGLARQYCEMLGKQDNCQVAVRVSLACEQVSLPTGLRLYLPREWAKMPSDAARSACLTGSQAVRQPIRSARASASSL